MKKIVTIIAVSAACLAIYSDSSYAQECKPKHAVETVEKGSLSVATVTYIPASFVDTDGVLKGVDGDIVAEIAKMECLQVKLVPVDVALAIQSIIARKVDLTVGAWYRTAKRAEIVNMSDPMYLDQMVVLSKAGYQSVDDLMGKKVGTISGTVWADDTQKLFGDNQTVYPNEVAVIQDMAAGRTEATITGGMAGPTDLKKVGDDYKLKVLKPDDRILASKEPAQTTLPISKDNPSLLTAINEDIAELRKSGKLAEILETYGIDKSAAETGAARVIK